MLVLIHPLPQPLHQQTSQYLARISQIWSDTQQFQKGPPPVQDWPEGIPEPQTTNSPPWISNSLTQAGGLGKLAHWTPPERKQY